MFGQKNTHIVMGRTGKLLKEIMKQAKENNSDDIVVIVSFDEKQLTWRTDSTGQEKPLFNSASSVHRI